MTGKPSAFTFQRDFGGQPEPPLATGDYHRPLTYREHQAIVRVAEEAARAQGFEAGRAAQASAEAAALAAALERVGERLGTVAADIAALEEASRREAVQFALAFARKLAGKTIALAPVESIETTAAAVFADLRGAAHVAVRVSPPLVEPVKERLGKSMRDMGLETRLIVFPDPEIASGDTHVEWADGGIVRDTAALSAALEQALAAFLPTAPEHP